MQRLTDVTASLLRKAIENARNLGATDAEINSAKRSVGFTAIENKAFYRWIGSKMDKTGDLYLEFNEWSAANHWHLPMTRSQFDAALKKYGVVKS